MREIRFWVRTDGSSFSRVGAKILEKLIQERYPVKAITTTPTDAFHAPTFQNCGKAFTFIQTDTDPLVIVVGTITEYMSRRAKARTNFHIYIGPSPNLPPESDEMFTTPEEWLPWCDGESTFGADTLRTCGLAPLEVVPVHVGQSMGAVIQGYQEASLDVITRKLEK